MVLALTLMVLPGWDGQSERFPLTGKREFPEKASLADPKTRHALLRPALDRIEPIDSSESGWAKVSSKIIGRHDMFADKEAVGAIERSPIIPNPEPSSMLIWVATVGGIFAAGYGLRNRQTPLAA
jgi:hypothetical protein